ALPVTLPDVRKGGRRGTGLCCTAFRAVEASSRTPDSDRFRLAHARRTRLLPHGRRRRSLTGGNRFGPSTPASGGSLRRRLTPPQAGTGGSGVGKLVVL